MSRATAVIFDMDGVLVNSEPCHERAYLEVVRALGYGETHGLRFADYVGRSDKELWQDFLARHKASQSMAELLELKNQRIIEVLRREEPLFAGVLELLEGLAGSYQLGLASGSELAVVQTVLSLKGLGRFFPVVVSASQVARGKPAPDVFLRAAQLLGVAPADCWVVEDSKHGVSAALAAGMRVVAITNTYEAPELSRATCVVSDYGQIARLLLEA